MNSYGRLAREHWQRTDPSRYAEIGNPQEFFSALGRTVESQVQDLQLQLAGPDPASTETPLEKIGRLRMARLQAEEAVLAELVWIIPAADAEILESENPGPLYLGPGDNVHDAYVNKPSPVQGVRNRLLTCLLPRPPIHAVAAAAGPAQTRTFF